MSPGRRGYRSGMHTTQQDRDGGGELQTPRTDGGREPSPTDHVVVTLRPLGSPTSLGLFGLAAATFTVAVLPPLACAI